MSNRSNPRSLSGFIRSCYRHESHLFSIWVFFHKHSQFTEQQGKGEAISLTPLYHFHPLHRHLDISRAITTEGSPLHIASRRTRTGNLWFPSASRLKCWIHILRNIYIFKEYGFHLEYCHTKPTFDLKVLHNLLGLSMDVHFNGTISF